MMSSSSQSFDHADGSVPIAWQPRFHSSDQTLTMEDTALGDEGTTVMMSQNAILPRNRGQLEEMTYDEVTALAISLGMRVKLFFFFFLHFSHYFFCVLKLRMMLFSWSRRSAFITLRTPCFREKTTHFES